MIHWTALKRLQHTRPKYEPANLRAAMSAAEEGRHLIPIVGKSSRPLHWFNTEADRDELFNLFDQEGISSALKDRLARCYASLKDASVPLNPREEAKLQAVKEVKA